MPMRPFPTVDQIPGKATQLLFLSNQRVSLPLSLILLNYTCNTPKAVPSIRAASVASATEILTSVANASWYELLAIIMDRFKVIQTLSVHPRFSILEARAKEFEFPLILKLCEFSEDHEAEFFLRSALSKTTRNVYSRPLLSVFSDFDSSRNKSVIVFVWKQGDSLDPEVEQDQESEFPPGKGGYSESQVLHVDSSGTVKRAQCVTLGKEVILKVSKHADLLSLNPTFEEALLLAKNTHPNICGLLDFRLFRGKSGGHRAYIVTESLRKSLAMQIQERASRTEPYDEAELVEMLQEITSALLHAKSLGVAHQGLNPWNILCSSHGLKLTGFGWGKELILDHSGAQDTDIYISPESHKAKAAHERLQRPFASDVFSLGMTMFHLAAFRQPRIGKATGRKLQGALQHEVQALSYSDALKRLVASMLSTAPGDRPTLESVREETALLRREAPNRGMHEESTTSKRHSERGATAKPSGAGHLSHPDSKATADSLHKEGDAFANTGKYEEAVAHYAAADAIYSHHFPEGIDIAHNFQSWALAFSKMGKSAKAVGKFAAAHATLSRHFPHSMDTVHNLTTWGQELSKMGKSADAMQKYEAADAIYARYFPHSIDTANNLQLWGVELQTTGKCTDARVKYAAADLIYSGLFPDNIETARNFKNWGYAYEGTATFPEATEKFAAADSIYSRLYPTHSEAAFTLWRWGHSLTWMKHSREAMEKCAAANSIYSRYFPYDISSARNLLLWGVELTKMEMNTEATEKFEAARAVFVLNDDLHNAYDCDRFIREISSLQS